MVNRAYNVSMSVVCTPNNRNCNSLTLKFIFLSSPEIQVENCSVKTICVLLCVSSLARGHAMVLYNAMTNGIAIPTPLWTPLLCQLAETIVSSLYKWLVPENAQNSIQ